MAASSYRYKSITSPDTIRLIHIHPSPDLEAEIECSLAHATLKACAQDITEHYVALSHVWGDASLECAILVDGQLLAITASLHCALRYLRDESRLIRVWADGICIDQKSNEDRSFQVAMMGSIYSIATHTVIFLGKPTPELELTMELLESRLSGIRTRLGFQIRSLYDIQEDFPEGRSDDDSDTLDTFKHAELFQILESRRGSGVSDPRDMIFAHLGLTSPSTQSMIHADYNKSIAELYEEIARAHIETYQDTSILSHVEDVDLCHRREGLPSWVPDWERVGPIKSMNPKVKKWGARRVICHIPAVDIDRKYNFHTRPQPECSGCIAQIPRVLGLIGWDLGPIALIIPASSLPTPAWAPNAAHESLSIDSSDATGSLLSHGSVRAKCISEWIRGTETSLPEMVQSLMKLYRQEAHTIWNKLRPLESMDLKESFSLIHQSSNTWIDSSPYSFLVDIVAAWFPSLPV
ncbi:hypothetical protein IFR05_016061 [Cadophora sp. M221]|nr:hypothetical protein IFR05_016061 [Cadophora sp. M221]